MDIGAGDQRRLELESLLQASKTATGLSDIGEPDILPEMRRLIADIGREAEFSANGIEAQRAGLIRVLSNRMRIEDTFKCHPEILREEIRGPIIITGLPRSGTTKLHRMMAASPGLQKLPLWKILHPVPLGPLPADGNDIRITIAEQTSAMMREYFPDFYAGHPMLAHEPDEEEWLLDMVMRGYTFCHTARLPSFEAWMDQQDFTRWYVYLRKLLQLLQWQDGSPPKPWLLKAPSHLRHMPLLFKAFPNSTIVHCHRDPVVTIPSIAKVIAESRRMYSDRNCPAEVAEFCLQHWARQMQGYMDQRSRMEQQHRFVDLSYGEIAGDVMASIERIYTVAGFELSSEARSAMHAWELDNPPGKHGQNKYTLEHFDLSAEKIRILFRDYLARFGHLIEI